MESKTINVMSAALCPFRSVDNAAIVDYCSIKDTAFCEGIYAGCPLNDKIIVVMRRREGEINE